MSYTWKAIYDAASLEVGMIAPHISHNHTIGLGWATLAQHNYQTETSVVKRHYDLYLDENSPDGVYDLPCSIRQIIRAEWFPDSDPDTGVPKLVEVAPWATVRDYTINIDQLYTLQDASSAAKLIVGVFGKQLYLYPFRSVGGLLRIYAIPHLYAYTPGDTLDWANFGPDPALAMAQYGPEPEMLPAIDGIIAFTKAKMISIAPGGAPTYPLIYQMSMAEFEKGFTKLRKVDTSYAKNYRPKARYSPIR